MLTSEFNPHAELTTDRFFLRAPLLSDAAAIAGLRSDPRVNQFLDRAPSTTVEEAEQFLGKILANVSKHETMYWVITEKDSGQLVGAVCFWNVIPAIDEAEIGYELRSEFFGKGVMQEVMPAVLRFGFEVAQLRRIIALPSAANERSLKLLEQHHFAIDEVLKQRLEKEEDMTGILCYLLVNNKQ